MRLKAVFEMWSWVCAVRFNPNSDTMLLNDKDSEFTIIPNSSRYWCADPFLFRKDGCLYLFFEAFDIFKRKGVLGYREISENSFGEIKVIYEGDSHLSFPFIYEENGEIFIIPESAKDKEVFVLKCLSFPDKWVKVKTLLNGSYVDTVRFVNENNRFLITEKVVENSVYNRVDLFFEKNGQLCECKNNPVKLNSSCARGAGAVFKFGDTFVRPAQDCSSSYGEKLSFNKIISLNEDGLNEELIETLSFRDINTDKDIKVDGIHTYNKLENIEVIDLRIPGKFNLLYALGIVNKIFRRK